ncbi:pyridoxal 5'-phosphate synthase glutaminase subunit PdxT [Oceanobacillus senegalensis]|uniref:pyridoxal 5'-phosphate synthase glutaminase subunit PdxT n=1 Tax=Oceanobacillus senegalensis TaxID=1936063 RepID=UPI002481D17D|nr:pyridoxal 5'-phosphate synthase glutaminase subunit PdxT [Oceanobacillus senegalensis]
MEGREQMDKSKVTIGVLGLQGAINEHLQQIESLGLKGIIVKRADQLSDIDGLILPGGESTTMRKLIDHYGFLEPLKEFSNSRKPILGTCAGMVLVAKDISGTTDSHLHLMDIVVKRNAFGRQKESFEAELNVKGLNHPFRAVFIRAPYIESVSDQVEVLAQYNGKIVAAKQNNILVSSFHPELTKDTRFLELFLQIVNEQQAV